MGFFHGMKSFLGFEDSIEERVSPDVSLSGSGNQPAGYAPKKEGAKVIPADFQVNSRKVERKKVVNNNSTAKSNMGIIIMEPRSYEEDSHVISCYLKEGHVVVINLKYLDAPTSKRLVDFVCGTIYAFEGYVKKLGGNIFLCTPGAVNVFDNQQEDVIFNERAPLENPAVAYTQDNMFYHQAVG